MQNSYALYGSISYNIDDITTLKLMAKNKVKQVFLWWGQDDKKNLEKVKLCKTLGLEIQTAHFDFDKINSMWIDSKEGDNLVKTFCKQLKQIKKHNINIAVLHVTKSKNPPPISDIAIKRYKKLVAKAEKLGVIIALENTRMPQYFDYIFDNISSDNLKICYDSGHDHAFTQDTFDFDKYKGKIVCLHIHDNNGQKDQHLLPFDGNINWDNLLGKLKAAEYQGPITLEVVMGDDMYDDMSAQEFILTAVQRAKQLAKTFNNL